MTDLPDLFESLVADLGGAVFPPFPTENEAGGNGQPIETKGISHLSHISHLENRPDSFDDFSELENSEKNCRGTRARGLPVEGVGKVGKVGNEVKTPAASSTSHFPPPPLLVGKKEEEWEIPDPTASHRPEWLDADTLAALAPQLAPPTDDGGLPIPPSAVRTGVDRELRALAEDGRDGPDALRDAIEITRAKIRNSEVLAERQANGAACHVCNEPLDDILPVIAVPTAKRNAPLFLHAKCHDAYRARRTDLVDQIMAAAGFGPTASETAP